MADYAWTADTVKRTDGTALVHREFAETVAEGDWVYEVSSGGTVGVADVTDSSKDVVFGQAETGGVAGKTGMIARPGAIMAATATPAIAANDVLILSAGGNSAPIADLTTADYLSIVAIGTGAGTYEIQIINTGVLTP